MNNKEYICALLASILTPLGVWAGIELDKNNWVLAVILVTTCAVIEFINVIIWFNINKEIHT